jgi:lipid-binding SYLF domain-containing protein
MQSARFARSSIAALLIATFALSTTDAATTRDDEARLTKAAGVLNVFASDEEHGIPNEILQRARGIAVIPNLIRGGFVFGGRRGRGVIAIRAPNGEWSNPAFLTLTGGSFGAQFGAEAADVVLVFANDRAVRNMADGKFTLGADASAIAGPVGRRSTVAVTGHAEVYVYMTSRGLYAGAAFEGTRLDIDQDASAAFYGSSGAVPLGAQGYGTPSSVQPFLDALRRAAAPIEALAPSLPATDHAPTTEEAVTFPLDN